MLLVDIGNSCVKWAFCDELTLINPCSTSHKGLAPQEWLEKNWKNLPTPNQIWVSNVAGLPFEQTLGEWANKRGIPIQFACTLKNQAGVQNGYERPEQLGIDRWLAIMAAYQTFKEALCVVDCGSALTLDVVDGNGQHLGGHILLGWQISISTFQAQFRGLSLSLSLPSSCEKLARNTQDGIQTGYLTSRVSYLHHMQQSLQKTFGRIHFVITGGEASVLLPHLKFPVIHKPYLVLEGLAYYALNNAECGIGNSE